MLPLFDVTKIKEFKEKLLPLQCEYCSQIFYKDIKQIKSDLKLNKDKCKFCSTKCFNHSREKIELISCAECTKEVAIQLSNKVRSKSGRNFCSKSCATTYNNKHKTTGTRRSKLEKWIEEQLTISYPSLQILYNQKDTINSELDIYIPSLKLAFELNGIFHYESIFGSDKLLSIQNNDDRKFQACLEANIELVIMDVSTLKYFKLSNTQKYLDIIKSIIDLKK